MQLRPGWLTAGRPSSLTPRGGCPRLKLGASAPPDLARKLAGTKTLPLPFNKDKVACLLLKGAELLLTVAV